MIRKRLQVSGGGNLKDFWSSRKELAGIASIILLATILSCSSKIFIKPVAIKNYYKMNREAKKQQSRMQYTTTE